MKSLDNFSLSDLGAVLSTYNFGEIISIEELSKGNVQKNILIRTANETVVLKYYKNRKFEYVEFEAKLLEKLYASDYSSPRVHKNNKKELVTKWLGKGIVITEYIEGEHRENLSNNDFEQLVTRIAELHIITENLEIKGSQHRWNYSIDFCKSYLKDNIGSYRKARQLKKKKWAERELDSLDIPRSLPKGIIHSDLHYTNIIFSENRLEAIIDFDDANYSYLIFDMLCLIDSKRKEESFLNEEYFKVSKEVICKYERKRKLQEKEKRSLYDILILSIIIDSFWFYDRNKFPDFKEKNKIDLLRKMGRSEFYDKTFG